MSTILRVDESMIGASPGDGANWHPIRAQYLRTGQASVEAVDDHEVVSIRCPSLVAAEAVYAGLIEGGIAHDALSLHPEAIDGTEDPAPGEAGEVTAGSVEVARAGSGPRP